MAIIGKPSLITPIGVHHIDFKVFKVPLPIRREGNAFTVRRP